jgi:outer membrane murein-binding lipoprotein Lpp
MGPVPEGDTMSTARSRLLLGALVLAPCLAATGCASKGGGPPPSPPASADDLKTANEKIARLEKEFGEMREKVDAHDRVLKGGASESDMAGVAPPAERPPVSGSVLVADLVNDSYTLSRGTQDGVYAGDEFSVFRGTSFVAVVVVDKVFAERSLAVTKMLGGKPHKKSDIRQGDRFSRGE